MQLNLLKSAIQSYEAALAARLALPGAYFWEICEHWRANWDIEAPDFCDMLTRSLHSNLSRKLWKDERGDAKAMLLDLFQLDPEFGRRLFRGLLDEEKTLSKRLSHFQFGFDILMEEYKKQHRVSNLTDHLHDGPYYPMLYLFFAKPEVYAPYFHHDFKTFMEKVKAHPTYHAPDVERFLKVNRTVYHYIAASNGIQSSYERWTKPEFKHLDARGIQLFGFYNWFANR